MRLSRSYIETPEGSRRTGLSTESPIWNYPERVLQIGEGNFLRGFADWALHRSNVEGVFQGRVVVVAPRPTGRHNVETLRAQDGLFNVWLRGLWEGTVYDSYEVVTSISRAIDPYHEWGAFLKCAEQRELEIVLSNTTEAGLTHDSEPFSMTVPGTTFASKLTKFLYRRFEYFQGDASVAMTIVPCELVEDNGQLLRQLVLQYAEEWHLPEAFHVWVSEHNRFCNTLVDRIVTGRPDESQQMQLQESLGCRDDLVTVGEPFMLWAIEGDGDVERRLRISTTADDLVNIRIVPSVTPYRLIKVRILNGAHTAMSSIAQMAGIETVGGTVADTQFGAFIRTLLEREVQPVVMKHGIEASEVRHFMDRTLERFQNPFVQHELKSLSLNGLSKICVRLLPTIEEYATMNHLPPRLLTLAFTAHLLFYRDARQEDGSWSIQDNPEKMASLSDVWESHQRLSAFDTFTELLALTSVWGSNLNQIPGFARMVSECAELMETHGPRYAVQALLKVEA